MDCSSQSVEDLPIVVVAYQEIPGQRLRSDEIIILKMSHKITNRVIKVLYQSWFGKKL